MVVVDSVVGCAAEDTFGNLEGMDVEVDVEIIEKSSQTLDMADLILIISILKNLLPHLAYNS